jgi:hypothetical protein
MPPERKNNAGLAECVNVTHAAVVALCSGIAGKNWRRQFGCGNLPLSMTRRQTNNLSSSRRTKSVDRDILTQHMLRLCNVTIERAASNKQRDCILSRVIASSCVEPIGRKGRQF